MNPFFCRIALAVLAAAVAVLSGCSPNTFFHPSGNIGTGQTSIEAGFSTAKVPGGGNLFGSESEKSNQQSIDIQGALGFRPKEWLSLRTVLYGGTSTGFGLGIAPRLHLVSSDKVDIGLEPQLGFLWAAISVPMSFQIVEKLWLYTQPSMGARFNTSAYQLPIGLLFEPNDGFGLMFVVGLDSKPDEAAGTGNADKLPDVLRLGLGLTISFGGETKPASSP